MVKIRKQFLNYSVKSSVLIGNLVLERIHKIGDDWKNSSELKDFMESIFKNSDLRCLRILKADKVVLSYPLDSIDKVNKRSPQKNVDYYLNMDNYLETLIRSKYNDNLSIMVRLSLKKVKKELISVFINYIIVAFIILSLSYFSILFFSRILTEPLKALAISARGISEGDYREIDIFSGDKEIDELIQAFNIMSRNLKKTIDDNKLAIIGKMSAGIAHEIRNPLVSIRGLTEIFLEDCNDEETKNDLEVILKEVTRLNQFTEQLLQFSRPKEIVFERMSIIEAFEDVITMLKHEYKEKNIEIISNMDESGYIIGDFDSVKQVLLNILFNAIQFSPKGGVISIKSYFSNIEKSMIKIEIADKGPGIPHENLSTIFEPFYTTRKGGSGLGLSIVKRIMHLHGGDIIIHSKVGIGTTVDLLFPICSK